MIFGLYFGVRALIEHYTTTTVTPDVVGSDLVSAVQKMSDSGLEAQVKEVSSDEYAAGIVIMQVPEAGETVQKGSEPVQLLVSTGARKLEMPSLTGSSVSDAVGLLKSMGITSITMERAVSGDYAPDVIMACVPEAGTTVDKDTEVTLTICGGEAIVPDLYMMTLTEAEEKVRDSQLTLSAVLSYVDTDSAAMHGLVAAQSPVADNHVILQTPVALSVYRCASVLRKEEIEVNVPENENDVTVKVTLQAEESTMEWTYVSYVCAADMGRMQVVTLELPDERNYICTVYIDGGLTQRLDLAER